ncbi:MAG TPA: 5-(carboxyamino)imidazole ribonucleotide mutase [Thermoanaerobaculia bacterium]|nr:5-(carboxyamino)imidazole ribonucleotide mutase [Thermoanaerobaculia bacterium]
MTASETAPKIGILMGSKNDWGVMSEAQKICQELGIPCEARVLSAHRTPDEALDYAANAAERGIRVLIAGAGGAAHLPGVLAAKTLLPVLGVPIDSSPLQGFDALLAIVQMPKGIPVGTLAVGKAGAGNAALLAAEILALGDDALRERIAAWRAERKREVLAQTLP